MKTDKINLTIPNHLYGDKVVTAYAAQGLAVAKAHNSWAVYHVASGAVINSYYQVSTRRAALVAMQELIAVPFRYGFPDNVWKDALGGETLRKFFEVASDEIRTILL